MYQAKENRYSDMLYRRTGKSGLMLPAVSLGLWHNFGSTGTYENMKAICLTAFDNGITHFDLADNYGPPNGEAQKNFGKILKEEFSPYRDELIISTKAGYDMWPGPYGNWGSRKHILASLDQSLSSLGLDYVDIFYHHRMDPDTPLEETLEALVDIVRLNRLSGLVLLVRKMPSEDWFRRAASAIESTAADVVVALAPEPLWDGADPASLPPVVLRELDRGSLLFHPLRRIWEVPAAALPQWDGAARAGFVPSLLVVPRVAAESDGSADAVDAAESDESADAP